MIVSSDNSMLIRAKGSGFRIHRLEDKYLLKEELTKEEKEARTAVLELERMKNRMPEPKLFFENGEYHIQISRTKAINLEAEVERRMAELSEMWPEQSLENEQGLVFGRVFNRVSPESIVKYNASRKKFLELSKQKILLEVQRDDLQRRMKRLSVILVNSGTAATGKMNVFMDVPPGVKLYYKERKKRVEYDAPTTPSYYPELSSISMASPFYGYSQPIIEMWDLEGYEKDKELRQSLESLTHGLQYEVFEFYVDSANCINFQMKWIIVDAALIEPVSGQLNVSFQD